jgi:hypothetical protein
MHWWTWHSLVYLSIHHTTSMILGLVLIDKNPSWLNLSFSKECSSPCASLWSFGSNLMLWSSHLVRWKGVRVTCCPSSVCRKSSEPSPHYYSFALFLHAYLCRSKHKEFKNNLNIFKDGLYSWNYYLLYTMPMLCTCWAFGLTHRGLFQVPHNDVLQVVGRV